MKTYMVIFLRSPQLYSNDDSVQPVTAIEVTKLLILWKTKHGYRRPGRPKLDYVTLLTQDTGLTYEELRTAMSDREFWRNYVDRVHPTDDDDDDDDGDDEIESKQ